MKPCVLAAFALALIASPGFADDTDPPKPVTAYGSVALVSDYRFRGVSQSDLQPALQGGLTVGHRSGFYAGAWASNLAGWGTFGGANLELDLFGGYKRKLGGGDIDLGLTWYMYPGGADTTDFAEPYAKVSGTIGPASLLAGVAYAPPQRALGNFSATPFSRGQKEDNIYVWGDAAVAIVGTPLTAKMHIGRSEGNPGLGPNGTSIAPTGRYADWMLGLDGKVGPVTVGVAYVDTNIKRAAAARLQPNFSATRTGGSIADAKVVVSVSAGF